MDNILESSRKRKKKKKNRELEKEREREVLDKWKVEKKRRGWRYMGIRVRWRKIKRKKKRNVWMIERKK